MTQYFYKFLARGALGPITAVAWPKSTLAEPGAWLESGSAIEECRSGIHLCRRIDLSHWLHDELWQVEVAGELQQGQDCVIAPRGRLLRRIDGWSHGGAERFASACRDHLAQLVQSASSGDLVRLQQFIADASAHLPRGNTALAAFCSAMGAAWLQGGDHFALDGYRMERAWQSDFLAQDLSLA